MRVIVVTRDCIEDGYSVIGVYTSEDEMFAGVERFNAECREHNEPEYVALERTQSDGDGWIWWSTDDDALVGEELWGRWVEVDA